jgi:hypothetical protein
MPRIIFQTPPTTKPIIMKHHILPILAALALIPSFALAHGDIEIGPNGGRVFELESKTTPHLEVGAKDGKFVIHVLDAKDKTMPIGERTLAITGGDRSNPVKLVIEKSGDTFTAPIPKGEKFPVVFQLREKDGAKPLTARLNYDASTCGECKKAEWLCACGSKKK